MAVSITNNLAVIDGADATTGWTSGGVAVHTGFQREDSGALGNQASEGFIDPYFTLSAADFSNRTILAWMRSGNPDTEANDGLGIIVGDLDRILASTTINAAGSGYTALDVVTVVGGTGTAATVNVLTVGGSGEALTVSVASAGTYTVDPSSPAATTGGTGTALTLNLTMADGTTTIRTSYTVGGSDNFGHFVLGWAGFRLDTASLPTGLRNLVGTAPPSFLRIIQIGLSLSYVSKATGNSDNVFWDQLTWIANGSPALDIAGGTTGARGTFAEIVTIDIATTSGAAYGILRELVGAKAYELFFGIDFGAASGDTFFDDSDFQLFINGNGSGDGGMSAGNMDVNLQAGTGTNLFRLTDGVVVGIGTISNWDLSAAYETMELTRVLFTDLGTIIFPPTGGTLRQAIDCTFNNCGQVDFDSMTADGCIFNGSSNALGAVFWDENSVEENQDNLTFNSDGTGHAIEVVPVGAGPFTFNIDGYVSTGYQATSDGTTGDTFFIVDNASDANVTINLTNTTGAFAYERKAGYTGTVSIVSTVNIEVTGVTEGARVSMHDATGGTERLNALAFTADGAGAFKASASFDHGGLGDTLVDIRARSSGKPVAAIADDNTVLTDETIVANNDTANTITLLPTTPVANQDRYYYGHHEQFLGIKLDITDAATGATLTWEFWDGTWTSLPGLSDGTSNYSVLGSSKVLWTTPAGWITTTINGQGPYFYVRSVLTAGTPDQARGRRVTFDVKQYLPFAQQQTITSSGLSAKAVWIEDTIATF